ncbi:MAG: serine/threonine-protein kinase [Pseudomonadota bacterium]
MTAPDAALSSDYMNWQRLAIGGLGETWRATDMMTQRPVVIKLRPRDPKTETAAQRESNVLSGLRHPGLQQHLLIRLTDDHIAQVYAFVEGVSVEKMLRDRGPLMPTEAVALADVLLAALSELHARNVIHRDVSPQNVILGEDGQPVLIDFNALGHLTQASKIGATTVGGEYAGKLLYMTPEQILGAPLSAAVDIWAVGALLYEMVVGKPYRQGRTPAELLAEARNVAEPDVSAAPAMLRPALGALLAQDAGGRPDTTKARAMLQDVMLPPVAMAERVTTPSMAHAPQPAPVAAPAPPPKAAPRKSHSWVLWVLVGLIAAFLGAVAAFFYLTGVLGPALPDASPPPSTPTTPPASASDVWRERQTSLALVMLGIGLMSVGLLLARLFRKRAASVQSGLPFQAASLIAEPDARSQLTKTILVEIDAYHAAAGSEPDRMLTVTMVALAKEYADAETSDARMRALSMLHDLHSKVATRLRPWWLDYETLVARGISLTGLGAGLIALFEGVQRLL